MSKDSDKKSNYLVRVRCVVIKEVVCNDCTRNEAVTSPFDYALDEVEIVQEDWGVISVKEDK